MTCIIVEDDPLAQEVLQGLVERTGFLHVQSVFTQAQEAVVWLTTHPTDLLFLDMELPDLHGLDLLRALPHPPQVIIVSSQEKYAVDAFDFDVAAYLLKPVTDYARFLKAVLKVQAKLRPGAASPADHLFIKNDSLLTHVALDEILWVEAFGDYVKINTPGKTHTVYGTLKAVEDKLPTDRFVRVHRSYVVNLKKIANITAANLQIDKKIIPIGTSYREALMKHIQQL
ncbi:MAG: LytTR family DNA-binding domain-containing protein [Cyclobacteriaceae bacterium]|jgi:DNA-binding LytR/AlgR family response regulator|nr:LytTR family DNA-binding domain-containing protein [Cyclobacteriaceae bacterium]